MAAIAFSFIEIYVLIPAYPIFTYHLVIWTVQRTMLIFTKNDTIPKPRFKSEDSLTFISPLLSKLGPNPS